MEPIAPKKVFISFGQGSRNLLEGSEGSSLQFGTARLGRDKVPAAIVGEDRFQL